MRADTTTAAIIAPVLLLLWGGIASGQDSLTVNHPVEREIAPGTAHSYTIHLDAGEYVARWVDQRGIVTLVVAFLPDGSRLRAFGGPPEGKRQFAIVAETEGPYLTTSTFW